MEKIIINGSSRLCGEVSVSGSKNSLSAILPAVCLKEENAICQIENTPIIEDTFCLCDLLRELGLTVVLNVEEKKLLFQVKLLVPF